MWLGAAALADGRLDVAERELKLAHARFDRPASTVLLAEVWLARGKYLQAEQLCQRAGARFALHYGAESPEVARVLNVQARACAALGMSADAAVLAKLAYTIRTKKLPKGHPDLIDSVQTYAALWRADALTPLIANGCFGRPDDTEWAVDHLNPFEAALPANDLRRADGLLIRGRIGSRARSDRAPAAEKDLCAAIQLLTALRGPKHPALADYWTELARVYGIRGKLDLAESAQEAALDILQRHYGKQHPRLAWALANMSEIQRALGNNTRATALLEDASRVHFSGLTDLELCTAFARLGYRGERTEYLLEMSRRKGPVIVRFLTDMYAAYLEERQGDPGRKLWDDSNVELLTALRRAQNKPDPLPIVVSGPEEMETIFPNLPVIEAALVNRDAQKRRVTFQAGGDYRSGRQDRWRFDVRDARGNMMPVKQHQGIIEGGGLSTSGVLKHGESWDTIVPMRKFIELPPGDYTVTVEYHDQKTISDHPHTAGLLVCRSEPFKLHVQPRVLDVTKNDREAAKAAIAELGAKGPVLILEGTYGKGDHDFIKPDSAPGKLLTLGWRAVPALLDELEDRKLTPQRRAWVLAVLYSITSWNDPFPMSGALGTCDVRGRGWAVSGGKNGKVYAMGLGSGGALILRSDTIDEKVQKEFAERWKVARDYIVVREKP
jgi:tetratricopeptide (TPR) repeat protein